MRTFQWRGRGALAWLPIVFLTGCFSGAAPVQTVPAVAPAEKPRFGLFLPLDASPWADVLAATELAEEVGFDSVWVNDHLLSTPPRGEDVSQLEGWTTLAGLAAHTERLKLGVLVTGNTYRNPALLAKMATTIDHVSGGRLILGLGAGWFEREHEALGFEFGTARERAEKLDESLQVITKLWSGERADFEGKHYRLDDAPFAPRNVQDPHPPIIIGGQGKKWIVPLVGRWADGWNAPTSVGVDGYRERLSIIREECRRVGREDCPTWNSKMMVLVSLNSVPLSGAVVRMGARALVGDDANSLLAGTPAAVAEHIQAFVDAGANEILIAVLAPYSLEDIRRLATEVLPNIRPAS